MNNIIVKCNQRIWIPATWEEVFFDYPHLDLISPANFESIRLANNKKNLYANQVNRRTGKTTRAVLLIDFVVRHNHNSKCLIVRDKTSKSTNEYDYILRTKNHKFDTISIFAYNYKTRHDPSFNEMYDFIIKDCE